MKVRLFTILMFSTLLNAVAAYTEFYVQPNGDNLNSGSTSGNTSTATYAGGTFVRSTGVFTVASGNPILDISLPEWASIYTTSGATTNVFTAYITGTNSTTITVSLTAAAGSASSVSESAGDATCKVGGAWKGPSSTVTSFPFSFATTTLTNSSGDIPCVNILGGTTYVVNATITNNSAGPILWAGYTNTVRDGGRAAFDQTNATATVMFASTGGMNYFQDFDFTTSAATSGSVDLFSAGGARNVIKRCVFHHARRNGLSLSGTGTIAIECEAFESNLSQAVGYAGFGLLTSGATTLRCISHDNTGNTNCAGFYISSGASAIKCVADSNSGSGFQLNNSAGIAQVIECDSYNNSVSGIDFYSTSSSCVYVENCNFIKNGGYGISSSGSAQRLGSIINCRYGSGTMANGGGSIGSGMSGILVTDYLSYAADAIPWVDAANGDFRINLSASKAAGRGSFLQTSPSYSGTVAYPDVGAAQSSSAAATGYSSVFVQ